MQTVAITQRKNIQYFSSGYPATFIPFDALSSLSGKEQREFKLAASSPVVLPPTVTANAVTPQLLTSTHRRSTGFHHQLFFFMKVSIRELCALLYSPSSSTHHGLASNKELQKISQKFSSSVRSSNEFFFLYSVEKQLHRMSLNGLARIGRSEHFLWP